MTPRTSSPLLLLLLLLLLLPCRRVYGGDIVIVCWAPSGLSLPLSLLFALPSDAIASFEPLRVRLPAPAVTQGGAYGEWPEPGLGAKEMLQVAPPPEIESVRQLGRVLLVQVFFVAFAGAGSLHLVVGEAARTGLEFGVVIVPYRRARRSGYPSHLFAFFWACDSRDGVLVDVQ